MVDHVLVIGFGGPTTPEEVAPFLERVTRGRPIPPARLEEVRHHYEAVGGRSTYNEETFALVRQLEARLCADGFRQPVFVGMRNWHPFLQEVIAGIHRQGLAHGVGVVLAPHRSEASFERYLRSGEEAKTRASAQDLQYHYLPPWFDHPLFIEAQADRVRQALEGLPPKDLAVSHLLFSAHAIPRAMASLSRYAEEVETSSREVARRVGSACWSVAYQSRSGDPREPWLEPDVETAVHRLKADGIRCVVAVPVGFLCDNVEVLFDLDIEARQAAEDLGLRYVRAETVKDHPAFVELLAQLIQDGIRKEIGSVGRPSPYKGSHTGSLR